MIIKGTRIVDVLREHEGKYDFPPLVLQPDKRATWSGVNYKMIMEWDEKMVVEEYGLMDAEEFRWKYGYSDEIDGLLEEDERILAIVIKYGDYSHLAYYPNIDGKVEMSAYYLASARAVHIIGILCR